MSVRRVLPAVHLATRLARFALGASVVVTVACGGSQSANTTAAPTATAPDPLPPTDAGLQSFDTTALPTTPAAPRALTAAEITAIVGAADRTDDDRKIDDQRKPDKLLAFTGIGPGMKVGEIGAGGGYTTELLARAVAVAGNTNGKVYGENSPDILKKFAEAPWSSRLARPVNKNIVRQDAPMDAPFPDGKDLDLVIDVLFYHDTAWLGVDRDKMNKAVFAALKPGGLYVIVDHSAKPGSGIKEVKTTHRIEESVVKDEIQKAGFKLVESGDFLRNPKDTRDWNDSPKAAGAKRGTSDRFVLKFQKP